MCKDINYVMTFLVCLSKEHVSHLKYFWLKVTLLENIRVILIHSLVKRIKEDTNLYACILKCKFKVFLRKYFEYTCHSLPPIEYHPSWFFEYHSSFISNYFFYCTNIDSLLIYPSKKYFYYDICKKRICYMSIFSSYTFPFNVKQI